MTRTHVSEGRGILRVSRLIRIRPAGRGENTYSLAQRLIALLLGLLIVGGGVLGLAGAAHADNGTDDDLSLYAVSSSVAAFFGSSQKSDSDSKTLDNWTNITGSPATAGGMLGYADKDFNPVEWLISQATASSQALDYSTLGKIDGGLKEYAQFGATLSGLGLDSTSTGLSSNLIGWLGGALLLAPFVLSASLNWAFNLALTILSWLNPFKLLFSGVQAVSPDLAAGMTGGEVNPNLGPLAGLASFLGDIYSMISSLSWAVLVPIFVVTTFAFLILSQRSRGSRVKKLLVRMVFIVIGIPLLGSMYTNVIDGMQDATSGADNGATQVVISTFVDFETWATDYRLAVPSGATLQWDTSSNQPTTSSTVNVQDTALAINQMTHSEWSGYDNPFSFDDPEDWTSAASGTGSANESDTGFLSALSMIVHFMNQDQVSSSSFAANVQGQLTNNSNAEGWFKELRQDDLSDIDTKSNPLLTVADGNGLSASTSGNAITFSTNGSKEACGAQVTAQNCSMSALSMYNYLNTKFGSTSLTTYSSNKVASGATQEVHNSVSLVGTGFTSLLYWLNAMVLLTSFVVIGFGYAVAMFVGNIRNGIHTITATPFALMGALPAITKVIVYAVAMLMELLVTIFLFKVVQELLIAMPKIFTHFIGQGMNLFGVSVATSGLGLILGYAVPILVVIVIAALTIMAMRLRKTVVKAVNEASTKIIEVVTGSNAGSLPGGGGSPVLKAAAAGIGAGAGMAVGGKLMGGEKSAVSASAGGPDAASASGTMNAQVDPPGPGGDSGGSGGSGGGAIGPLGGGTGGTSDGTDGANGANGSTRTTDAIDQELGVHVSQSGLTAQPADGSQGTKDVDVMDTAFTAGENANETQKQAAAQKRDAALAGVTGAALAARAVARGYAGDGAGAVSDGAQALGSVSQAQQKAAQAKQTQRSLDAPSSGSSGSSGSSRSSRPAGSSGSSAGRQVAPARQGSGGGVSKEITPARQAPAPTQSRSAGTKQPAPARGSAPARTPRQPAPKQAAPARPARQGTSSRQRSLPITKPAAPSGPSAQSSSGSEDI